MQRRFMSLMIGALVVLVAACGSSTSAAANTKDVQVTVTDFKVTSSLTTFAYDTPYQFTVRNTGTSTHEFMIMPPMDHTMMGSDVHKMALIMVDAIAPGATTTVTYTFKMPSGMSNMPGMDMSQKMEFSCHKPGHYEAGMSLPFTVK